MKHKETKNSSEFMPQIEITVKFHLTGPFNKVKARFKKFMFKIDHFFQQKI